MGAAMRESEQMATPAPADPDFFGDYSPAVICASALILVLAISVVDKLTGYGLQVGVLYLVPVALVTWAAGRAWGTVLAILAAALWLTMFRAEAQYRASLFFHWDALVLLLASLAFVVVIGRLRDA